VFDPPGGDAKEISFISGLVPSLAVAITNLSPLSVVAKVVVDP
jgi:hypothetical protein